MRIALLSYRSKTHCGGQGVYVRHLSHGLVELGHDVEVFSGQPYPELLDPRVRLTKVPSLDLYREPDPFRVPRPARFATRSTCWNCSPSGPRAFPSRGRSRCAPPGYWPTGRPISTSSTTTRAWAPDCSRSPARGCRWWPPCTTPSPVIGCSIWPPRGGGESRWCSAGMDSGDAAAGGAPDPGPVDGFVVVGRGHRRRLRRLAGPTARRAVGREHRAVQAGVASPATRPGHRDRQRRHPAQGCRAPCCRRSPGCARAGISSCGSSPRWNPTAPPTNSSPNWASPTSSTSPVGFPTPSWPLCSLRPRSPAFRRSTKGFRCPRWKPWRAVRRSWRAGWVHCPKSSGPTAPAPSWCRPPTSTR